MIPEPLTAISLCVGLLGFISTTILSTIEKSRLTIDTLREHEARLNAHRLIVRECDLRLRSWYKIWEARESEASVKRAQDLWGSDGVEHIRLIEHTIGETGKQIQSLLQTAAPLQERGMWNTIFCWVKNGIVSAVPQEMGVDMKNQARKLCNQVSLALYRNSALKEPVANLKTLVASLELTARDLVLEKHGCSSIGTSPERDILLGITRTKRRHRQVSDTLQMAYEALNDDQHNQAKKWALVCKHYQSEKSFHLESPTDQLPMEFLRLHDTFTHGQKARMVDEAISLDLPHATLSFSELLRRRDRELQHFAPTFILRHSFKRLSEIVAMVSHDALESDDMLDIPLLKVCFARATEMLRLKAALDISSSATLFWDTAWIDQLCTCSTRYAVREGRKEDICVVVSSASPHDGSSCNEREFLDNPDLLLGLALAELAISRPVCLRRDTRGDAVYHVHTGESEGSSTEIVTASALLRHVGDATGSKLYTDAVEYCLIVAQGLRKFESEVEVSEEYQRNVVKKLERVLDDRQKLREVHGERLAAYTQYWETRFEEFVDRCNAESGYDNASIRNHGYN